MHHTLCPQITDPAISPGCVPTVSLCKKWWQTNVSINNMLSQWGNAACTQESQVFFFWGGWGGVGFFHLLLSPICSQCHHTFISYALPKVGFFSPIHMGQSGGSIYFYLENRNLYFREPLKYQYFLFWLANQQNTQYIRKNKLKLLELVEPL